MGCGQSKILIYHRKSKQDKQDKLNYGGDDSDASDSRPEQEGTGSTEEGVDIPEQDHPPDMLDTDHRTASLLDTSEISSSQIDFFKMLDEKIESGADYEEDDVEREQETQRLRRLLQDWLRRPHLDTQRFPTAYHPVPPTRTPRLIPRLPLYAPHPPQPPRAYLFTRTASLEGGGEYQEQYERRGEDGYGYGQYEQYPPVEPVYYNRVYAAPMDGSDVYARNRAMLAKTSARAMSFDVNPYSRSTFTEDEYTQGMRREMHYPQHPVHIQYVQHHDQMYPRDMPPLQGAPGPPPGPPHGSPRPLAMRIPTTVQWRRPRGPVTELA